MITSFYVNLIENAAKKCSKRQFAFVLGRVKDFLSHMEVGRGGYGIKAGSRQSSREWLGRSSIAKTARN